MCLSEMRERPSPLGKRWESESDSLKELEQYTVRVEQCQCRVPSACCLLAARSLCALSVLPQFPINAHHSASSSLSPSGARSLGSQPSAFRGTALPFSEHFLSQTYSDNRSGISLLNYGLKVLIRYSQRVSLFAFTLDSDSANVLICTLVDISIFTIYLLDRLIYRYFD